MNRILEYRTKDRWNVMLSDNGELTISSLFVWRRNHTHVLPLFEPIEVGSLPAYVLRMVYDMRDAHRGEFRLPLTYRTLAWFWRRQGHLKISYTHEPWGERVYFMGDE